jgi:hypothetical protein
LNVPVVTYDVGFFYELVERGLTHEVGVVLPRSCRSPQLTMTGVNDISHELHSRVKFHGRGVVSELASLEEFGYSWRTYLREEFGYGE